MSTVIAADAGIDAVHGFAPLPGFVPPRVTIARVDSSNIPWEQLPTVALFTDFQGERVLADAPVLQFAYDKTHLFIRVSNCRAAWETMPHYEPDSPHFWRQDHVEFRFAPVSSRPYEQVQFILGIHGRYWDTLGLWKVNGARYAVERHGDMWSGTFSVPLAAIPSGPTFAGKTLRGLAALTQWRGECPRFLCASPVGLGFSHFPHFCVLRFAEKKSGFAFQRILPAAEEVTQSGVVATWEVFSSRSRAVKAVLHSEQGGRRKSARVILQPGRNEIPIRLAASRRVYIATAVALRVGKQEVAAASVTVRAMPRRVTLPNGERPRLLLTHERVKAIRKKIRKPVFRGIVERFLRTAVPDLEQLRTNAKEGAPNLGLVGGVGACLTQWIISADAGWITQATEFIREADQRMVLTEDFHLQEGNVSPSAALAFDAFYPLLSADDRAVWVRVLSRLLDCYLRSADRHAWTVTAIPNANAVTNSGGGLLALALGEMHPRANEALGYAQKYLRTYLDYCQGRNDGGNTEGVQYWAYGVESLLRFAVVLHEVTGEDEVFRHPAIRKTLSNIRVALCNDGSMHGINDTVPMPVGAEVAWCMSGYVRDPLALWYGDHAVRTLEAMEASGRKIAYYPNTLWSLIHRPDKPEATVQPVLPKALALHDIEVGIVRSSSEFDCVLDAGLKGSRPPYTHHNQPDTGAFFLDVRGERMIIDPGYYKPKVTDHSLPLIGGVGPITPALLTGKIVECASKGALRYLAVDSTGAYAGAAERDVRHMVMAGEAGVVLLDDIVPTKMRTVVTAQYQCGGTTSRISESDAILIQGKRSRVELAFLAGPARKVLLHSERRFDDSHWGYSFAECRWFPVTCEYEVEPSMPLVCGLLDVTKREALPWTIHTTRSRIEIAIGTRHRVVFARGSGKWECINFA